jgi:hypothetical protein
MFWALLLIWPTLPAEAANTSPGTAQLLSPPPRSWAIDATVNELPILEHPELHLRYKMHVVDEKGDQLRDVIESKDGTVARLIARDGRPLTEEEDRAEQQRLKDMIASPALYQKHISGDVSGKRRAAELIKMLPDAMVFSYTPGQPQLENLPGEQVVLDFKPNPAWQPPNLPAEALTGLQGRVWIDARSHHMVRMEGEIFRGVNVGWGMLAHIFPGGKLTLDQTAAAGKRWIVSDFTEKLTVRALMVKTIRQDGHVNTMDYTPVEPMSYQDAIRSLLATPLPR